jgi:hypothetical protein
VAGYWGREGWQRSSCASFSYQGQGGPDACRYFGITLRTVSDFDARRLHRFTLVQVELAGLAGGLCGRSGPPTLAMWADVE